MAATSASVMGGVEAESGDVTDVCNLSTTCACCRFLPDDLFLPPSSRTTANASDELNSRNSITQGDRDSNDVLLGDEYYCVLHPREALSRIQSQRILLVDTHSHAHLEREASLSERELYDIHYIPGMLTSTNESNAVDAAVELSSPIPQPNVALVSLTCAVEPNDWQACLEHTAQSPRRLAALGIHPWYLDCVVGASRSSDCDCITESDDVDENDANELTTQWMSTLEELLVQHPRCMVGEIGLCKMAKFLRTYPSGKSAALQLQRNVFQQQLRLASKHQRPASIHCVNQHGVLLDVFKELWPSAPRSKRSSKNVDVTNSNGQSKSSPERPPPAMALHSYTGTAHHVRQLLQWEEQLVQQLDVSAMQSLLYFGFSHAVNVTMCTSDKSRRQGREAIRAIPRDRLLAESDVHCTSLEALGTAGSVAYLAWARDESIEDVARDVAANGLRFLGGL